MIPAAVVPILKTVAPYAVVGAIAASAGFSAAWWLQGVRLDAERNETARVTNEFKDYRTEQQRLKNDADRLAEKRRQESDDEWKRKYAQLQKDGDAYRRCVAAGRCGGLRPVPACSDRPGIRVPAPERSDGPGPHAVPLAGESAAETPGVIEDCAVTTLMLNELQADIEKQLIK